MKPRIYRKHGIWTCRTVCASGMRIGYGYTPMQAYREWQR